MEIRKDQESGPDPLGYFYSKGGHAEAIDRMTALYAQRFAHHRKRSDAVSVMDYGTGYRGVGRVITEHLLQTNDHAYLFDGFTHVRPTRNQNVHVIDDWSVSQNIGSTIDILTISYVLCSLRPRQARQLLLQLHRTFPQSELIVVDYVLKGRDDLLELLTSKQERDWRRLVGEEDFREKRTQFSIDSLRELLSDTGWTSNETEALYLDSLSIRAGIVVPHHEISYSSPSTTFTESPSIHHQSSMID